jgi:hypothetical protein
MSVKNLNRFNSLKRLVQDAQRSDIQLNRHIKTLTDLLLPPFPWGKEQIVASETHRASPNLHQIPPSFSQGKGMTQATPSRVLK